jgi:hypothetical protein
LGVAMLGSFKRFFAKHGAERDLTEISAWAQGRGFGFKRVRGEDGFVVDGTFEGMPWRAEWGAPQRAYIQGHEFRLRMELDLPPDLQMLLLSRPLLDSLERKTFEEFTDNVQTQIGTKTPEEMRWLVMFPKVNLVTLKALRANFGAVASAPAVGLEWLAGPLDGALVRAASDLLQHAPPFVLMTLRGRLYLRMQLWSPGSKDMAAALALFEVAVARALAVAGGAVGHKPTDWDAGANTAWQSLRPDGPPPGLHKRR